MVMEFSTFGSFSSRSIFNSKINNDYENYFHINYSVESVTLISLMSEPIKYDYELINSPHPYDNKCIKEDLSKDYLNFLKNNSIDYLIIDTYFDVVYGIYILDNEHMFSSSIRLKNTDLHKEVNSLSHLDIINNFDEYMKLWVSACNQFFNFMNTYCKNTKIILNCSRSVYKYLKDGKIYEDENLKKNVNVNEYRDILDSYILNNFDVEILPFDENTLADKNHIFGLHQTHYESKYYSEKKRQLNDIIHRNLSVIYDDKFNKELRYFMRKNLINEIYCKDFEIFNSNPNIQINKLFKYLTARIDIKNVGMDTNDIEILEISDKDAIITKPKWFKNEFGNGTKIQGKLGYLHLKIRCINDGKLNIRLRGVDFKDNMGKRLPIFIKYTKFKINNENIINEPILVHHNNSYSYEKEINHSKILDIYIEWNPI